MLNSQIKGVQDKMQQQQTIIINSGKYLAKV